MRMVSEKNKQEEIEDGYEIVDSEESSSSEEVEEEESDIDMDSVFCGQIFSLSGTFSMKQNKMAKLIKDNGGRIRASPDEHTNYVLVKNDGANLESKKWLTATQLKIPIIVEDFVHDSIDKKKMRNYKSYIAETDVEDSQSESQEDEEEDAEDDDEKDEDNDIETESEKTDNNGHNKNGKQLKRKNVMRMI